MRVRMKADFNQFISDVRITERRVEFGSEHVLRDVADELADMTLAEVPRATETLAKSFFKEIESRNGEVRASLGYGGNGDPVNPKTKQRASQYMLAVHEDLTAMHPNGKAKFLEDPLREIEAKYAARLSQGLQRFLR